jgi:hypothetical protein
MLKHLFFILLLQIALGVKNLAKIVDVGAKASQAKLHRLGKKNFEKGSLLDKLNKEKYENFKKTSKLHSVKAYPQKLEKFVKDFYETIKLPKEYQEMVETDILQLVGSADENWEITRYLFNKGKNVSYTLLLVQLDGNQYNIKFIDINTSFSVGKVFAVQTASIDGSDLETGVVDIQENKSELDEETIESALAVFDFVAFKMLKGDSGSDSNTSDDSDDDSVYRKPSKSKDKKTDKKKPGIKPGFFPFSKDDMFPTGGKNPFGKKDDKKTSITDIMDAMEKDGYKSKKKPYSLIDKYDRYDKSGNFGNKKSTKYGDDDHVTKLDILNKVIGNSDKIVDSITQLVALFKNSRSETIKERIEGKGYDYFEGKSSVQFITNVDIVHSTSTFLV